MSPPPTPPTPASGLTPTQKMEVQAYNAKIEAILEKLERDVTTLELEYGVKPPTSIPTIPSISPILMPSKPSSIPSFSKPSTYKPSMPFTPQVPSVPKFSPFHQPLPFQGGLQQIYEPIQFTQSNLRNHIIFPGRNRKASEDACDPNSPPLKTYEEQSELYDIERFLGGDRVDTYVIKENENAAKRSEKPFDVTEDQSESGRDWQPNLELFERPQDGEAVAAYKAMTERQKVIHNVNERKRTFESKKFEDTSFEDNFDAVQHEAHHPSLSIYPHDDVDDDYEHQFSNFDPPCADGAINPDLDVDWHVLPAEEPRSPPLEFRQLDPELQQIKVPEIHNLAERLPNSKVSELHGHPVAGLGKRVLETLSVKREWTEESGETVYTVMKKQKREDGEIGAEVMVTKFKDEKDGEKQRVAYDELFD